jgi:hypothetical protein
MLLLCVRFGLRERECDQGLAQLADISWVALFAAQPESPPSRRDAL